MAEFPKETPITQDEWKDLMKMEDELQAIQRLGQMFQDQMQARLTQAQMRMRNAWASIAKRTGIDLDNVLWAPHRTNHSVIPLQVSLKRGDTPTPPSNLN